MKCIMGDVQGAYSIIKTILLCFKMIKIVMMPYWNATFSSQRCSIFKLINWRDHISSNNSRDDYFSFCIKREWLFSQGRRLFEILLTESCTLNILFY